ncbi:MAG: FHA domain-containing protein, partial [Bradymonadaceae bacterium]
MSVGGLVIFALGLTCGIGVALYLAQSSGDDPETAEQPRSASSTPEQASEDASGDGSGIGAEESSVGVEELMGGTAEVSGDGSSGASSDGETDRARRANEGVDDEMVDEGRDGVTHWLEGLSGSMAGKHYELEQATSVGRLPRNDLQVNEGDVSRVHCRFRIEGDDVVVEALDTPNGTRVEDREVTPGEAVSLTDEDVVEVGNA